MRADAKRNYELIVETARAVFREKGYDAPLDEIAKRAGVGPGTLYRHFPTRDVLVDAVMQAWIDRVDTAVEKTLAFEGGSHELLMTWLRTYVQLISLHKGGPAKLTCAMGDEESPIRTKCQVLARANDRVLERLRTETSVRPGVDGVQLARLTGGIATVAEQSSLSSEAVDPLLETIVTGVLDPAS